MIKVISSGPFAVNSLVITLSDNKVLLVDPAACAFSGDETKISSFLAQNNLEPVAVVLTHGHFDHVCGIPFLKKCWKNLPVLIHKNDSMMLGARGDEIHSSQLSYMGFEEFIPSVSSLPESDGFLEDKKNLFECMAEVHKKGQTATDFFDTETLDKSIKEALERWQVIHTPGHTSGGVCLYNREDKILISGDTLFYGSWGRTDLGGNEVEIMKSLRYLKDNIEGDTVVYPGHDYYGFKMSDNY